MSSQYEAMEQPGRDRPSGLSGPERQRRGPRGALGPERRSSPRMQAFDYVGPYAYSLTINTANRHRAFVSGALVDECGEALREACYHHGFTVEAYCFMPDHLHLLLVGSDDSALVPCIKRFKQRTAYVYRRRTRLALWERSYYDHVLRSDEDIAVVADYIWDNPVRANLVQDRAGCPFSGPRGAMEHESPSSQSRRRASGPDRPKGLSLRRSPSQVAAGDPIRRAQANRNRIWLRRGNIDVVELLDSVRGPWD